MQVYYNWLHYSLTILNPRGEKQLGATGVKRRPAAWEANGFIRFTMASQTCTTITYYTKIVLNFDKSFNRSLVYIENLRLTI